MPFSPHFPILKELGLTETEALLYELLIELGPKPARDLVEPAKIGRGNVYNGLTQLQHKGFVTIKQGNKQVYEAVDPSKLLSLLVLEQERLRQLESSFASALPQLSSTFNLSTGKPAIQVFEGIEGFEKALEDSLTTKGEILTYVDLEALQGPFADINRRYIKLRAQKKINKRAITSDTPAAREYVAKLTTPFTQILLVKDFPIAFKTAMELYDTKVTYLTLRPEKTISVVLEEIGRAHV
jgi:sugar-specific transcriptional regulator TrmB